MSESRRGKNAPKRALHETEAARAEWVRIIAEQRRSGVSVARFCAEQGLSASSLFAWRRRLEGGGGVAPASGFVEARVRGVEGDGDGSGEEFAINGMPDHLHALVRYPPDLSHSDMLQNVKGRSSRWLGETFPRSSWRGWQEGFGGFTVSRSLVTRVEESIRNQKDHHLRQTYEREVIEFHRLHDMEFVAKDAFEWLKPLATTERPRGENTSSPQQVHTDPPRVHTPLLRVYRMHHRVDPAEHLFSGMEHSEKKMERLFKSARVICVG